MFILASFANASTHLLCTLEIFDSLNSSKCWSNCLKLNKILARGWVAVSFWARRVYTLWQSRSISIFLMFIEEAISWPIWRAQASPSIVVPLPINFSKPMNHCPRSVLITPPAAKIVYHWSINVKLKLSCIGRKIKVMRKCNIMLMGLRWHFDNKK